MTPEEAKNIWIDNAIRKDAWFWRDTCEKLAENFVPQSVVVNYDAFSLRGYMKDGTQVVLSKSAYGFSADWRPQK